MADHPSTASSSSDRGPVDATEITEHDRVKIRPAAGSGEPTEILHFEPRSRVRETAILVGALTVAAGLIAGTWWMTRRGADVGQGGLVVISTPSDAEVLIDSVPLGRTPFSSSNLETGRHSIMIKRSGYQPIVGAVEISPHKIVELRYPLQPQATRKP